MNFFNKKAKNMLIYIKHLQYSNKLNSKILSFKLVKLIKIIEVHENKLRFKCYNSLLEQLVKYITSASLLQILKMMR